MSIYEFKVLDGFLVTSGLDQITKKKLKINKNTQAWKLNLSWLTTVNRLETTSFVFHYQKELKENIIADTAVRPTGQLYIIISFYIYITRVYNVSNCKFQFPMILFCRN